MYHHVESDPLVGTLFDERYLVNSLVARGGMGSIYHAHDTRTGTIVALKILRSDLSRDPVILHRFQLESSVVSRLKHPNICQMFDSGCVDGDKYYFTMEFLEGQPLDNILKRRRTIDPVTTIRYMLQVASALCDAHNQGIIHRDLKPANIFIVQTANAPEFAKVLDFGVAKIDEDAQEIQQKLTSAGATLGTPFYMSPEQIHGSNVDGRSDVYALGIIFWECLFGMPPYTGNNLIEIFQAVVTNKLPKLPANLKSDRLWQRIYKVLVKALQKDREKRYSSMAAFLRALEELQAFAGIGNGTSAGDPLRTHESLPAISFMHTAISYKVILAIIAACFCIGGIITTIFLMSPTEVAPEQVQLYTYKFFSDVPAQVLVNNKPQGKTPLTIDISEKPPLTVHFKAPDIPGHGLKIKEESENITGYAINLAPKVVENPGILLETVPAGASVYINGLLHDELTPCEIKAYTAESIHVEFRLNEHRTENIQVIHNGGNFKLRTNLFRIRSK